MPGIASELSDAVGRTRTYARRAVTAGIVAALGEAPAALEIYDAPLGDPGLFGPDSIAWRVHADLGSMLIGGFSALMLQSLHPLAMAGVAEHSNYRDDPLGRLRRTARFVAGTTFGAMPLVEGLIATVRAVHDRVEGCAPDGRHYSANDPALLTWVHVSEVSSFLAAYQRFGPRPLLRDEKDRYLAEVAVIANLLGAPNVPESLTDVRRYLAQTAPELALGESAAAAIAFLGEPIGTGALERLGHKVLIDAALDLLPPLAKRLLGRGRLPTVPLAPSLGGKAFTTVLRASFGPSVVAARARARVAGAAVNGVVAGSRGALP